MRCMTARKPSSRVNRSDFKGEVSMKRGIATAVLVLAASGSLLATAPTASAQGLRDLIGERSESRTNLRDLILDLLASRDDLRDLLRDRLERRDDLRDLILDRLATRDDLCDLLRDRLEGRNDLRDLIRDRLSTRDDLRDLLRDRPERRNDRVISSSIGFATGMIVILVQSSIGSESAWEEGEGTVSSQSPVALVMAI